MSQTNGAPRVPKTCAQPDCFQQAPDTTLCWKHQTKAAYSTSPPIQVASIPSPSRTLKDGERKAKRTRTNLFASSSVPSSARFNGTYPTARDPTQAHATTQQPWPSPQQTSASYDGSRQTGSGRTPGTPGTTAHAHLRELLGANIRSYPKLPPDANSSATLNSTSRQLFHQNTVLPPLNAPQWTPGPPKAYGHDITTAAKLSNHSRWFHTPQSTPYARPAARGAASKTSSPDTTPRTPERMTPSANSSGRLADGIARPLHRYTEAASSPPTQSHSVFRSSHQHDGARPTVIDSQPRESTVGSTNLNETRGLGITFNPLEQNSSAVSNNMSNYSQTRSNPADRDGLGTIKPATLPGSPAVQAHLRIHTSSSASTQGKVDLSSQDYIAGNYSPKFFSKHWADERPGDGPFEVQSMAPNTSFQVSRESSQVSNPPSTKPGPGNPKGIGMQVTKPAISIAEARRRSRVFNFDSSAFDSQIYAQDDCLPPPEGVPARECQESVLATSPGELIFVSVNPAIHGMHSRSEAWYAQKAVKIQQRPRRKAWFGKVHERKRWLRSQEKESRQEREASGASAASSFPRDPQPWSYRRPIDFGDVPEDELPADVRENPAWVKICGRFREDRATKMKMDEAYLCEQRKRVAHGGEAHRQAEQHEKEQDAARQEREEQEKRQREAERREREEQEKRQREAALQGLRSRASQEVLWYYEKVKRGPSPQLHPVGVERATTK